MQLAHKFEDELTRWVLSELDALHLLRNAPSAVSADAGNGIGMSAGGGDKAADAAGEKTKSSADGGKEGRAGDVRSRCGWTERELVDVALAACSLLGLANACVFLLDLHAQVYFLVVGIRCWVWMWK